MAALPYIQLYPADYLADTSHLTTVEHGAYMLLIMNYWQRGEPFHAKDQQTLSERLARTTRMTGEEWASIEPVIAEFFEVSKTQWRHLRIERDLAAVLRKSTQARFAGKVSGEKRKSEKSEKAQDSRENLRVGKIKDSERTFNGRSTDAERTINHTEADTDTDTDTETLRSRSGDQGSNEDREVLNGCGRSTEADHAAADSDLLGEKPKAKPKPKKNNIQFFWSVRDLFHETLPELARVVVETEQRKRLVYNLRDSNVGGVGLGDDLENWRAYFRAIRKDDFIMGRKPGKDGTPFKANFDYILRPAVFTRITEARS